MTEDEMAGWHHQLDGCEFEKAPGVEQSAPVVRDTPFYGARLDMTDAVALFL